jgi:hypothetical protein
MPHSRTLRLLEIETAKVRLAWAQAQVESGDATPALTRYIEESRQEVRMEVSDLKPLRKALASLRYSSRMDILKMLDELRTEHARIVESIIVLERIASGQGKRRGRPPLWMAAESGPKRRGRPPGSKNKPKDAADA